MTPRLADPILIVGAGVGGLTAALALHQAGFQVRVYESDRVLRALGVGINLLPQASRILARLMLSGQLAETAIEAAELAYCNHLGQRIRAEPLGRAAGHADPQFSIHRGELTMILLRAVETRLGRDAVHTGHHLDGFVDQGDAVVARFVDRETRAEVAQARGAALVGADGIHSVVRRGIYPDEAPPRFAGRTLGRALSEGLPFLDGRTMVIAGRGRQKLVCGPISKAHADHGRSLISWMAELETEVAPPTDWSRRADPGRVQAAFADWRFDWLDVPNLLAGARTVFEYPLVDRDPLPQWSFGRVTLLGDAAHPTYPIGSYGATQAILDAADLADRLARSPSVEEALGEYDAHRRALTSRLTLALREHGPERILALAEDRAPQGFRNVDDVIAPGELEAIARRYRQAVGLDPGRPDADRWPGESLDLRQQGPRP